jgi:Ni,Fe-hydrogenase III large subunit/Ni,Fe-hydrogenase III component G
MPITGLPAPQQRLAGEVPASVARVSAAQWIEGARLVHEAGGRLVAIWGADRRDAGEAFAVYAAYATADGLSLLELPVAEGEESYPDVSGLFPCANRMQRAVHDLLGLVPDGAADLRPWLRHGAWRPTDHPLRRDFDPEAYRVNAVEPYPFVRVEGDGVHEIAVGPIHAGVIEPGHFRFSVVGEKVLRLEERFGYAHKGVDRRFGDFTVAEGYRLAGRCSADSTVTYAWAYAQAAESLLGVDVPPRSRWLRALMLEMERIANHLNDLGHLGNDAGFAFALAQFSRLREDWLRLCHDAFGHRLMMDRVVPGGVAGDVGAAARGAIAARADAIERESRQLRDIFDEHSGLQDRFITAGRVTPELARALGLIGLAGRASGQALDLRVDFPVEPYTRLAVKKMVDVRGDVAARVRVRFDELFEALRLVREILASMPEGEVRGALPEPRAGAFGVGWVEGWRGEVFVAIEAGEGGRIRRAHAHDPSWQSWPLAEHAIMGNIVPDFPLINKSFNLSYSGPDC